MRPTNEILIDYLDRQLSGEETTRVDSMIKKDKAFATEMQYLKLAIDTVRLNSINEKVSAVRRAFENNPAHKKTPENAVIRSMYKISMRIAAILILLFGSALLYKYLTVSDQTIYNKQFSGYELSNSRGQEVRDAEIEAYRNKNWSEVIAVYNTENIKSNKATFLAAMAEMQMNQYSRSVNLFEEILNAKAGDDSFREETEYYLSLAYLMNHQENKSIQLLNKIKADTGHTYYPLASKIPYIDLKIIQLKK
jgi:hypothetical protein